MARLITLLIFIAGIAGICYGCKVIAADFLAYKQASACIAEKVALGIPRSEIKRVGSDCVVINGENE